MNTPFGWVVSVILFATYVKLWAIHMEIRKEIRKEK